MTVLLASTWPGVARAQREGDAWKVEQVLPEHVVTSLCAGPRGTNVLWASTRGPAFARPRFDMATPWSGTRIRCRRASLDRSLAARRVGDLRRDEARGCVALPGRRFVLGTVRRLRSGAAVVVGVPRRTAGVAAVRVGAQRLADGSRRRPRGDRSGRGGAEWRRWDDVEWPPPSCRPGLPRARVPSDRRIMGLRGWRRGTRRIARWGAHMAPRRRRSRRSVQHGVRGGSAPTRGLVRVGIAGHAVAEILEDAGGARRWRGARCDLPLVGGRRLGALDRWPAPAARSHGVRLGYGRRSARSCVCRAGEWPRLAL